METPELDLSVTTMDKKPDDTNTTSLRDTTSSATEDSKESEDITPKNTTAQLLNLNTTDNSQQSKESTNKENSNDSTSSSPVSKKHKCHLGGLLFWRKKE